MSETEKAIKELTLEEREREVRLKLAKVDQDLANIEHIKGSMKAVYEDNHHITDTQTMAKMADKFIDQLKEKGQHFCLHEQDWGKVIGIQESNKETLKRIEDKQKEDAERQQKILEELIKAKNDQALAIKELKTTWKISTGIVISFIVGSWAVFCFAFIQLKELLITFLHK